MRPPSASVYRAALARAEAADFTSYVFQYPPLAAWGRPPEDAALLRAWSRVAASERAPGLYVHVPFCRTKCVFCRFFVLADPGGAAHDDYLDALDREAALWQPALRGSRFSTLYVGGGTPSLLSERNIERLFAILRERFSLDGLVQTSFEANPDFLTRAKLSALAEYGVTRLTIGVQSLDDAVTKRMDRTQDNAAVARTFRDARDSGIRYINVDLMTGLPGQTMDSWRNTLEETLRWRPDSIHVNPFAPTPLTRFSIGGGRLSREDELLSRAMGLYAAERMRAEGYLDMPYDAMALAPAARNLQLEESVIGGNSFLGLGCGAVSCAQGRLRHVNAGSLAAYLSLTNKGRLPVFKACRPTAHQRRVGFVLNRLHYGRLDGGEFRRAFGRPLATAFPGRLQRLEALGALVREDVETWRLDPAAPDARALAVRAFFEPDLARALARKTR